MKSKSIQAIPLLTTFLIAALAPVSNWCVDSFLYCYGSWLDQIYFPFTQPLYDFAVPALIIGIVLPFVSATVFRSWLKFSAWFLPLAFIFVALTPVSATRLGIDFYPYYRINAAHDAGVAFVVLSLLLIAWKYWRERRANISKSRA